MCFVGAAGVGKSTLLNTVVADRLSLLPRGGVGSLTSMPIRIVHADEPYLAIRRHAHAVVPRLAAELERCDERAPALHVARMLVTGAPYGAAPREYLRAALRAACAGATGAEAAEAAEAAERDRGRLALLAAALREPPREWLVWDAGTQLPALRHELELHAAGFLSPLVSEIELGWSCPALAELRLVDLPGLGVAHDLWRARTDAELARADAVVLVVDRAGITEAAAAALGPVLDGLARAGAARRPRLLVAVTQLDQIAAERRLAEPAPARRTWQACFRELAHATRALVRGQLAALLATRALARAEDRRARGELVARLPVVAVAPLEHQRFHRRDPEDPGRLLDAREAGVVELRARLAALPLVMSGPHRRVE